MKQLIIAGMIILLGKMLATWEKLTLFKKDKERGSIQNKSRVSKI